VVLVLAFVNWYMRPVAKDGTAINPGMTAFGLSGMMAALIFVTGWLGGEVLATLRPPPRSLDALTMTMGLDDIPAPHWRDQQEPLRRHHSGVQQLQNEKACVHDHTHARTRMQARMHARMRGPTVTLFGIFSVLRKDPHTAGRSRSVQNTMVSIMVPSICDTLLVISSSTSVSRCFLGSMRPTCAQGGRRHNGTQHTRPVKGRQRWRR
jgi:hypothetical protein